MDTGVFVSCFAAVALALLIFYIFTQFVTAVIAALILVLLAVIFFALLGGAGNLKLDRPRRRHR